MKPKFKIGDNVEIINYGHPYLASEEGLLLEYNLQYKMDKSFYDYLDGNLKAYENISEIPNKYTKIEELGLTILHNGNDGKWITVDANPEYVGQKGVICDVNFHKNEEYTTYAIDGTTKHAWWNEDQLKLL